MKIMVINGPEMTMLGKSGDKMPGFETLDSINERLARLAGELGISCEFFTGNGEGELVTLIQSAWNAADGIILNAGNYAHYSIAIRDAIASVKKTPVIEVHLTNIFSEEEFRRYSMLSPVCKGVIAGFGADCYRLALYALASELSGGNSQAVRPRTDGS